MLHEEPVVAEGGKENKDHRIKKNKGHQRQKSMIEDRKYPVFLCRGIFVTFRCHDTSLLINPHHKLVSENLRLRLLAMSSNAKLITELKSPTAVE
jgi:hypothetical protein